MTTNTAYTTIMQSSVFRTDGLDIDLCEAFQTLCLCINSDPLATDWSIGEGLECSLGDLIVGSYWAFSDCYSGQFSKEYKTLCMLGTIYSSNMASEPEPDSVEEMVYDLICGELLK